VEVVLLAVARRVQLGPQVERLGGERERRGRGWRGEAEAERGRWCRDEGDGGGERGGGLSAAGGSRKRSL